MSDAYLMLQLQERVEEQKTLIKEYHTRMLKLEAAAIEAGQEYEDRYAIGWVDAKVSSRSEILILKAEVEQLKIECDALKAEVLDLHKKYKEKL